METKRRVLPAAYVLITLLLMWPLQGFFPIYQYLNPPAAYGGVLLTILGILVAVIPASVFRKAETGLLPFDAATTLVTDGFYQISRNPMYLGMLLMLLGAAVLLGSLGAFLPIIPFFLIIRNHFVLGEERFLEATFGQPYLDYKAKVRRWI